MGKASSSKKVSRVARTGGGRTAARRTRGSWLFPSVMGVVVLLGVLGVWISRDSTQHKAVAEAPTVTDHWHAAYGFYICGNFLPNLPQPPQLIGLHTHGDGVIHIEPQDPTLDTGKNADLGRFISGYPGLKLSKTSLTVLNQTWTNGKEKCGDKPGQIIVKSNDKQYTPPNDPNKLKVPKNGWITIAFVPPGTDVPAPTDWQDRVAKANGGAAEQGPMPTVAPSQATPTSTPAAPAATPTSTPASAPPTSTAPGPPTTVK